jgi:hypothetical protein
MSGVVRPSAISMERSQKVRRPAGDPLHHGQRAARPFQAGTDPDLLWLGGGQQRILDRLESGVRAYLLPASFSSQSITAPGLSPSAFCAGR